VVVNRGAGRAHGRWSISPGSSQSRLDYRVLLFVSPEQHRALRHVLHDSGDQLSTIPCFALPISRSADAKVRELRMKAITSQDSRGRRQHALYPRAASPRAERSRGGCVPRDSYSGEHNRVAHSPHGRGRAGDRRKSERSSFFRRPDRPQDRASPPCRECWDGRRRGREFRLRGSVPARLGPLGRARHSRGPRRGTCGR